MNPDQLLAHFDRVSEAPDAIPRLRRFILDMALQGKLVGQDPADEPAEELLMRVEVEKLRLIKEGKIRERKRFQILKKVDPPFELPPTWRWVQLREISTLITKGSTPTSYGHSFVPSGINFIKVEGIKDGELAVNTVTSHISIETHEFLKRSQLEEGDFLFSIAGSIGTCAVVTKAILPANTNQALAIIRGTNVAFLPRFLQYSTSSSLIKLAVEKARGGAMNNISLEDVGNFALPLPPLAEQHRIVAKVDELMALCDQLEAAREERERRRDRLAAASLSRIQKPAEDEDTFREHARFHLVNLSKFTHRPDQILTMRKTILALAVRGKLVPQDPNDERTSEHFKHLNLDVEESGENLFHIPDAWAWVSVGQIADSRLGKMLDKAKNKGTYRRYLRNVNVRWLDFNLSDVFEMRFEDSELEEFALHEGDVLICEGGEPGRSAVWDARESDIYFQKAVHRVRFPDGVVPQYFVYAIRESASSGRLSNYFTGVGIKHFTGKGLASFVFPLPSLAEQHRIVAKVDELMALCIRLEVQLTSVQTESYRLLEALLHQALEPTLKKISA